MQLVIYQFMKMAVDFQSLLEVGGKSLLLRYHVLQIQDPEDRTWI